MPFENHRSYSTRRQQAPQIPAAECWILLRNKIQSHQDLLRAKISRKRQVEITSQNKANKSHNHINKRGLSPPDLETIFAITAHRFSVLIKTESRVHRPDHCILNDVFKTDTRCLNSLKNVASAPSQSPPTDHEITLRRNLPPVHQTPMAGHSSITIPLCSAPESHESPPPPPPPSISSNMRGYGVHSYSGSGGPLKTIGVIQLEDIKAPIEN